jgi:hypothetical protein
MIQLLPIVGSIIDKIIPDKEAADKAKLELLKAQQSGELAEMDAMQNIIVAEAQSEHVITATWRPVVMLTFTGLVVLHFLGFTAENISPEQIDGLLKIVQYGLTAYIGGRSMEKGLKIWKEKE